jgi:tetratricopeptide (TPR) repeat protein
MALIGAFVHQHAYAQGTTAAPPANPAPAPAPATDVPEKKVTREIKVTEEQLKQARVFFDAGSAAYARGQWSTAVAQFETTFQLAPRPNVAFALAQAERKQFYVEGLSQVLLRRAVEHYEYYLHHAPNGERRNEATEAIRELVRLRENTGSGATESTSAAISRSTLTITSNAEGAQFSIDGGAFADLSSEAYPMEPGEHTLTVRANGYQDTKQRVTCRAGQPMGISIQLSELSGTLRIIANKSGDIYIDGRPYGSIGNRSIELAAGTYTVSLAANGSPLHTETVVIERGKARDMPVRFSTTAQRTVSYIGFVSAAGVLVLSGLTMAYTIKLNDDLRVLDDERNRATIATPFSVDKRDEFNRTLKDRDAIRGATGLGIGIGVVLLGVSGALYTFDKPSAGAIALPQKPEKKAPLKPELSALPYVTPGGFGLQAGGSF